MHGMCLGGDSDFLALVFILLFGLVSCCGGSLFFMFLSMFCETNWLPSDGNIWFGGFKV